MRRFSCNRTAGAGVNKCAHGALRSLNHDRPVGGVYHLNYLNPDLKDL